MADDMEIRAKRAEFWKEKSELAYATTLVVAYIDLAADKADTPGEHTVWDPVAIISEVEQSTGVQLPQIAADRLLAGLGAINGTLGILRSASAFNSFALTLAGVTTDTQAKQLDVANLLEASWAIAELVWLLGEKPDIGPEIKAFIDALMRAEGVLKLPAVLAMFSDIENPIDYFDDVAQDIAMSSAVAAAQLAKTDAIDDEIKRRTYDLARQIEMVPLAEGDALAGRTAVLNLLSALATPRQD